MARLRLPVLPPGPGSLSFVRRRVVVGSAGLTAAALASVVALAQGSSAKPRVAGAAHPGLPKDIVGFERWPRLNFKPLPNRGGGAHPGVKRVYINKRRSVIAPSGGQRFPYPNGTIIVKTATNDGVVTLVAIGRKKRGFDKAHGDWQFIEYKRSTATERFDDIVRGEVCYSCHVGAKKTDWIFTRPK
jgi:hypothetical protein